MKTRVLGVVGAALAGIAMVKMGWRQGELSDELRGLRERVEAKRVEAVAAKRAARTPRTASAGELSPARDVGSGTPVSTDEPREREHRMANLDGMLEAQADVMEGAMERLAEWEEKADRVNFDVTPQVVEFEGFINYGSPISATSVNDLGEELLNVIKPSVVTGKIFTTRAATEWDYLMVDAEGYGWGVLRSPGEAHQRGTEARGYLAPTKVNVPQVPRLSRPQSQEGGR